MRKLLFFFSLISIINNCYSQKFDTLNIIDSFSQYLVFLNSTKTSNVCKVFKNSKYFSHSANRKPYPEYVLTNEYYSKYKITEVDFVSLWEIDSTQNFLKMFAFYSPVEDSSYISNKLVSDGWQKEKFSNDLKVIYRKTIKGQPYYIDNQKFPDEKTVRYYISMPH